MNVVIAGPDETGIAAAVDTAGHTVSKALIGNRPGLEEAGIHEADVFLLTDFEQATAIAVAKDLNPEVRVVAYAEGSLPDFASRQTDLVVDPQLLDPAAVAEEL
ncbi:CTP synthetase [Halobacteriales archaeon QS_4_62_28]|nr:MAG: CTP synthetase [Halobacteriales archaeon QS_4_62_28]